jgi:UDPglucose 6-dehydrogenase
MNITIIGTGYVGLVTGTCLADIGHNVTCVDIDSRKIDLLKSGGCPIYEPGLTELIGRSVDHERLSFTTNLNDALASSEVVFIAVGTPEGEDGSADLGYVRAVAKEIAEKAQGDLVAIVKSTVPVGTCDIVEQIINKTLADRNSSFKIEVASNPEFLKEGNAIDDFRLPDRIVCGVASEYSAGAFKSIYAPFITDDPGKLLIMDRYSSELTKYGSNAMLATRISFMNEIARLCEKVGANVDNVRRGMGSDPRIGRKFLYAGPGYGGSCFPKDVLALLKTGEKHDTDMSVLRAVTETNQKQKHYVAQKIKNYFGDLTGKKVALWGLTFKPGTDDVRETPAKTIIDVLTKNGAIIHAHDPKGIETYQRSFGNQDNVKFFDSAYEATNKCDCLVLVTEWPEYRRPNWHKLSESLSGKVIFDLRNQYIAEDVIAAGFHYQCIGKPDSCS